MTDEKGIEDRVFKIESTLGDLMIVRDGSAPKFTPKAVTAVANSALLMLEDGQVLEDGSSAADSADVAIPVQAVVPNSGQREHPPLPSIGLMTILKPALRAMHARLHAIRAECKING